SRHIWDIEPMKVPTLRKYFMAISLHFSILSGLIKLSVLLFYRRLSSRAVSPAYLWAIRVTMLFVVVYTLLFFVFTVFMCHPISAFWDQSMLRRGYHYSCLNEGEIFLSNGIISTIQDVFVTVLPAILCWNIQMPLPRKVALFGLFGISYTTIAISIVRAHAIYFMYFKTNDVSWAGSDITFWTLLEIHIGSMCANAPALNYFFVRASKTNRISSWVSAFS
ncbi:hypothetical protein GQ44DRAFT_579113, partial [Phaeosphaeriaceae sp. PMI808]